jgi:hypothetical protein
MVVSEKFLQKKIHKRKNEINIDITYTLMAAA